MGANAPYQQLPLHSVGAKLHESPRKIKITNKSYKIAKRTLHLSENTIRSFIFLLQEPDGAPLAAAAPAPGTTPLGLGQRRNAET
jgi:hypothetical protein